LFNILDKNFAFFHLFRPIFYIILPKENEKLFGAIFLTEKEIISSISEFAKNGKIILDLDEILGEGGEGLVVEQELIFMEKPQMCAVKFSKFSNNSYKTDKSFWKEVF